MDGSCPSGRSCGIFPPVPGQAEPLEISVSRPAERTFVVALAGELDLGTSPGLQRELESLSGNGPRRVVVDLSQLTFIDSSGISVVVSAARALEAGGGRLTLAGATSHVARVLEIAHVSAVVPIAATVEDALARPGAAAAG